MEQKPDEPSNRDSISSHRMGWVLLVAGLVVLACFLLPVVLPVRIIDHAASCYSDLKQSALALTMYAADYDDRLPASDWMDGASSYVRRNYDVFRCPRCPVKGGFGYAMHEAIVGQRIDDRRDAATILLFDSTLTQKNAVGGLDTLPHPARHDAQNGFAFADGHVEGIGSK